MKVYIIDDGDVKALLAAVDRDPSHGQAGGSSQSMSESERAVYDRAHRFYNYQVRTWLDKIQRGE